MLGNIFILYTPVLCEKQEKKMSSDKRQLTHYTIIHLKSMYIAQYQCHELSQKKNFQLMSTKLNTIKTLIGQILFK